MKVLLVGLIVVLVATATAEAKETEEKETTVIVLVTPLSGYLRKESVTLKSSIVILSGKLWRKVTLPSDADPFDYLLYNRTNDSVIKRFTVVIQFTYFQISGDFSLPGKSSIDLLGIDFHAPEVKKEPMVAAPAISNKRSIVWASLKK